MPHILEPFIAQLWVQNGRVRGSMSLVPASSAIAHTSCVFLAYLKEFSADCIISHGIWSAHRIIWNVISAPWFFSLEYTESKMYESDHIQWRSWKHQLLNTLMNTLQNEFRNIDGVCRHVCKPVEPNSNISVGSKTTL